MFRTINSVLILCASILCSFANAQECSPPSIVANTKSANLFSPEQEMIFGDLVVQKMSGEFRVVRDERLLGFLNNVGAKLIKHLPPTGLKFQFHLIEIPEANAFNIPGGHIFISRKLVAFVDNEDELVGVIAHELGHAAVRHGATDISKSLRSVLNVTALGDRKDIAEKYNLLIERARTKRLSRSPAHEGEQQLEADRIGLFAMVAAGYDPSAFSGFFDRLTESEGKTGNWFSDLFGSTRPEQKRLREMIRLTEQLPAGCRDRRPAKSDDFFRWQADVVSYREAGRKEELPGLIWKKDLAPKLRSDVSHIAFSPDGKLLLAQDDFAITVIDRERLRVLFQIPAENANEAMFTPDGKFVIFTTTGLRYEKWDVAEKKPTQIRELVLRRNCWEHKLSPDGNYLACVDTKTSANILATGTGQKIWEQKDFYRLSYYEYLPWLLTTRRNNPNQENFFRIEFSPDSDSVVFSRSDRFRFRFIVGGLTAGASENTTLALNLSALKPIDIHGEMKKLSSRPYIFLDSGKVVGMPSGKLDEAGVFSFPDGKRLQKFPLSAKEIKRTANSSFVVIKPLSNVKMGVFDLKRGLVASGLDRPDATLWNNLMAYESTNGKILIREVSYNEAQQKFDTKDVGAIEIPVGLIKGLNAAEVSNSFKWLLLSSKTRGGLWNLETGERKFYVRGFKGGVVADDGGAVGDFPKLGDAPHSLVLMNPHTDSTMVVRDLPERSARQFGRFVLVWHSLREQENKESRKPALDDPSGDDLEGLALRGVRAELKDLIQNKVLWSRDFPNEVPEYSFDQFAGRLIFYWRMGSDAGKAKVKESAELQARANALANKSDDYLVEIVDCFTQKTSMMLLETGKRSFDVGQGLSEGNWLMLHDSNGRLLIYSIKEGELRHRFFGGIGAINPSLNQIAVENSSGEIGLYNLDTGDLEANVVIDGSATFVRFNLEGNKLFVLSDTQAAYLFDLNKLTTNRTHPK